MQFLRREGRSHYLGLSSVARREVQQAQRELQTVLNNVSEIQALRQYGLVGTPLPELRAGSLSQAAYDFMQSPQGRNAVNLWVAAFAQSITYATQYSEEVITQGASNGDLTQ